MSELREILQNVLEDIDKDDALVDCLEQQIRQWALGLLPKEQVVGNEQDIEKVASINGKNLTIAEMRKRIEERI